MTIQVQFAFPVDEVRREDNGKLILIGVYARDIGVLQLPANLVLTLVISLIAEKGDYEVEVENFAGSELKGRGRGHLKIDSPGKGIHAIGGLVFANLREPTELKFRWRVNAGEWVDVCTIPFVGIRRGSSPPNATAQLPSQSPPAVLAS